MIGPPARRSRSRATSMRCCAKRSRRQAQGCGGGGRGRRAACRAATSISAPWRWRRSAAMTRPIDRAADRCAEAAAAAGAPGRVPARPFGRNACGGAAAGQGLSHRRAPLAQPGRAKSTSWCGAGALLVFVEVKARGVARRCGGSRDAAPAAPHRAPPPRRGSRATPSDHDRDIRFDAVLVAPWRLPRHIPAAFEVVE